MTEPKQQFYFAGKWFNTYEELAAYTEEFNQRSGLEEDFCHLFNFVKKDLWGNMQARNIQIPNYLLREILDHCFCKTFNTLCESYRLINEGKHEEKH